MVPMILGVGQGLPSHPTSPHSHEIIRFSLILGFGQGPSSPATSPKKYGNHNVFNDLAGLGRGPSTSHLTKKLKKS